LIGAGPLASAASSVACVFREAGAGAAGLRFATSAGNSTFWKLNRSRPARWKERAFATKVTVPTNRVPSGSTSL